MSQIRNRLFQSWFPTGSEVNLRWAVMIRLRFIREFFFSVIVYVGSDVGGCR